MTSPLDGNGVAAAAKALGFEMDMEPAEMRDAATVTVAAYLAAAASSHTAVEPVAGELAMLVNWLPKLNAALGSKPEHVDDVARLARVHALIPTLTAQAAALVAANERVEALMAERTNIIATKRDQLAAAESEVATLKARVAELEAGRKSERESIARMLTERARLARTVIETDCEPEAQIFEMLAREILSNEQAGK